MIATGQIVDLKTVAGLALSADARPFTGGREPEA